MRAALPFFILSLCLSLIHSAFGRDPLKISDATSPNGSFTLSATMEGDTTCHVEVKGKSGKATGTFSITDYDPKDRRNAIAAVWKADSTAFALNINHGPSITDCHIFAGYKGSWNELPLPKKPLDKVRQLGNQQGAKAQDFLSAEAWLPDHNLKVTYAGNNPAEYALIFHLVRAGKPRLEYLETIAPKPVQANASSIHELPCTFRVLAGGAEGSADGPVASAQFKGPSGIATDAAGDVFIADRMNELIRRITAAGEVETVAGAAGEFGKVDGPGKTARFWYPQGLAADGDGNVYVADTSGKCVRKVTPQGQVSTVAAGFKYPTGVATDRAGNVYVADANNYVIQKIARDGTVTVLAGKPGESGARNGRSEDARFRFPSGLAVTAGGIVYVVDRYAVRKIDTKGNVTTFAGALEEEGRNDGTGGAARFWGLTSIALDAKGNLYLADHELKNLRRITAGVVQTLRAADHTDLPLQDPMAVAIDAHGRIYVADQNANDVLLVELPGTESANPK